MRKISKRILALLLVAVMLLPLGIFSENPFVQEAAAANDMVSGNEIVEYAKTFLNDKYQYGHGYGPTIFDCCGLVQYVYGHFGIKLPWNTTDYHLYGTKVSESQAKPGDLVVWSGHVGIYIGDGYCINALNYEDDICRLKVSQYIGTDGKPKKHWFIRVNGVGEKSTTAQPTSSTSNYVGGVKVTLTTSTSGATIYYTTNGSTPTTSSTKYTGAFNLTSTATVKAIAVKSGMNNSSVMSKKITVNKVATPVIENTLTSGGFNMTITADKNATVYYTTDGTNPTTSSTRYSGQFSVYENATVKAIAVESGKANSAVASATLSAKVPSVPTVKLDSSSKNVCGIGDGITVSWNAVSNAYEYKAILSKNGAEVESYNTQSTLATFTPDAAGTYTITVKAVNFVGESAASSPAVTVTVKPNVTVTFKDYDGKVIEIKETKYGSSVTAPAPTLRTGYEFSMWQGKYTNVTANTTVAAVYTPKEYTVIFVDENDKEIKKEVVKYGEACKNVPTAPAKTGYKFAAWSVVSGDGNSYTKVNGHVTFKPTYVWANPDLPLLVTVQKAVRSSSLKSYDITVNITNGTNKVVSGKMVAVIKTANDKIVATAIQAVEVPANATNYTQTVKIGGTADGMLAEVYILANDTAHEKRTGGAYSLKASAKVTKEVSTTEKYWSDWSGWGTASVTASSTREVETKTQYHYRDKETTTSTSSTMTGWTPSGSTVSYGSWGSWSGWSTTAKTGTDVMQVESKTVYRYYYYACKSCGNRQPYWDTACWKCGKHVDDSVRGYYWTTTAYSASKSSNVDGVKRKTTSVKGSEVWFFSSGNLNHTNVGRKDAAGTATVIQKGYRTRTRTKTTTYSFWKWGDYSPWSDTVITATDTRQVETRKVYRYRDLKERESTGTSDYIVTENLSGTKYSFNGKLTNVSADYSGKVATIMVYKKQNIDSLEFQLEYIGQITLGTGNSYNFSFIPRQEISEETGDYIVSFGIATANGLVNNVEIVEAPKPKYKVDFYNYDGTLLNSQNVSKGESATAPALPEIDGYELRWNRPFTNIDSVTTVKAEKIKKSFNLIFVDWENDEIVEIKEAEYGSKIVFPADRKATGKKFVGWSVSNGATVTGNMVIEAVYDDITFTVKFLNKDGSVFETQTVAYGDAVVLPLENPTAEGYNFISWNTDTKWWNVTSNITVTPIFVFDSTVEAPVFTLTEETPIGFAQVEIETSTQDAEIRYTTDGTEPTEESLLFDDVVFVEETTTFKAKAFKEGMVASQSVENVFEVVPSEVIMNTKVSSVTDTKDYVIGSDNASLCMKIDNPYGYEISSWGYVLTNVDTEEYSVYENTKIAGIKDKLIGRAFKVDGLETGATYSYYFFAEFEEIGMFESDSKEFVTGSEAGASLSIRKPSITTIKYGDTIKLHADIDGTLPEGAYIEWSANNGNFTVIETDGDVCKITPKSSGDTTFTATVYDKNGNELLSDTQVMTSKAGFFDKLVAFFRGLFGLLKDYEQAIAVNF